jgi:peptide/nickel transport system substrate-binding protein
MLRRMAAAGISVGAGGMLAACGSGAASSVSAVKSSTGARRGGNLRVGLSGGSGSDTLDPHRGLAYLDTARAQSLYQPLLQLNGQAEREMVLATEISPHGSTSEWVIRLRRGVTFHDGKPLTADDVIYTFQRIISNNFAGANSLGPMDVRGLKKLDKYTVLVPMTSPYGSFLDQLAYWYYLYIVPVGFDPKKPNGTGPFRYESFTPGQRSVFTRNPHYWEPGLPHVDTVTIIDFADNTSLQNALLTRQVHAIGGLDGAQQAYLDTRTGIKVVASQAGAIVPFTMRMDKEPFKDPRVRQAMRLIVNRAEMVDTALDGDGTVGNDVFSPYDPAFNHSLRRLADIPQARHLLKQAGREGLTVELVTSPVTTGTVAMATVLQQQARQAGVTIKLKTVDPSVFFGPDYLKWTFSQDFYNYSPYLAQVAQSQLPKSPFNETHRDDPHYLRLYNQANATLSDSERREIEREMQQLDFTDGGYIIPAYVDSVDAYSTKITGYSSTRVGQPLGAFDFKHFSFT